MAFYRLEAKVISRGGMRTTIEASSYRTGKFANGGKSVVAAAGYRSGSELVDERTGRRVDYSNKRGVMGAEIMVPEGSVPWMQDRQQLWNAVERVEKRKDSQLAKDYLLTLPHELTHEQRVALTREFVKTQFCDRGYVADIAWHSPSGKGDERNHHAHVMVPMRHIEDGDFAKRKRRPDTGPLHPAAAWRADLEQLREAWAETANRHLEAAGLDIRIDHRSLAEQGIDRIPEPKIGPLATQIERSGRETFAGNDNRQVRAINAEREFLKAEHAAAMVEEAQLIDLVTHRMRSEKMPTPELSEEELRLLHERELAAIRTLKDHDERLQAFKRRVELQAEEARATGGIGEKPAGARAKTDAENRYQQDLRAGDIVDARLRASIALGENYDMRDPYGSLARSAGAEYSMFLREQRDLKARIAEEQNPELRQSMELRRSIEAHEYCGLQQKRLAGIASEIAGREDHPQAKLDRERAAGYDQIGQQLRKERDQLLEAREARQREEKEKARENSADPIQQDNRRRADEGKKSDEQKAPVRENPFLKTGERREGAVEMTDAKQAKVNKASRSSETTRPEGRPTGRSGDDGSR